MGGEGGGLKIKIKIKLTSVAGIHICNQGRALRIEICNHFGMLSHVVKLRHAQICHA